MSRFLRVVLLLGLIIVMSAAPLQAVSDDEVTTAIENIRKYLYRNQNKETGGWESAVVSQPTPGYVGVTALVTYALLASGESMQRPEIAQALKYLAEAELVKESLASRRNTYDMSFRAHVWARLPDSQMPHLTRAVDWLKVAARPDGTYGYNKPEFAAEALYPFDNSTTQYGLLGLWEGSKRGLSIGDFPWERVINYWITTDTGDGGWGYERRDSPTGSMTTAGLTSLLIAQQEHYASSRRPPQEVQDRINRGLKWLDANFSASTNPGQGPGSGTDVLGYYLVGLERVALASGRKEFAGQDWFAAGADVLVRKAGTTGKVETSDPRLMTPIHNSAFALMFLSRGRVPVWCTKLDIPGQNSNNHPNDIYFLTDYLSSFRESEVNWQVLSMDRAVQDWLSTPVLFLSGDKGLVLTAEQAAKLKRYLDLGGLLVANPDDNSAEFKESIRNLAKTMYPQLAGLKPLGDSHPVFGINEKIPGGGALGIESLSNGARDLIFMFPADWGYTFQAESKRRKTTPWHVAANLFLLATDRGVLRNRLVPPTAPFDPSQHIAIADWAGALRGELARRAGGVGGGLGLHFQPHRNRYLHIGFRSQGFARSTLKLTHLSGVAKTTLSEQEKFAISEYVKAGGTLLVESVGGGGEFSRSIAEQLGTMLGPAMVLDSSQPIISGELLERGFNNINVAYRKYSVLSAPRLGTTPRLEAILVAGRPAVIISHMDLSEGALDCPQWGIEGYTPQSARQLLTNIVIWADKRTK